MGKASIGASQIRAERLWRQRPGTRAAIRALPSPRPWGTRSPVTQIDIPELSANGLPARRAALSLVDAALARRGGFEEAMNTPPFSQLTGSDRAFARNLASTTLRGLGRIDHLLNARLTSPPPPSALALLRLGAAQILFGLAPAFAAVSTTVDLADQFPSTQSSRD